MSAYKEYKSLDLPSLENEVGKFWVEKKIFEKVFQPVMEKNHLFFMKDLRQPTECLAFTM